MTTTETAICTALRSEKSRLIQSTVLPPGYQLPHVNEHDEDADFWDGVRWSVKSAEPPIRKAMSYSPHANVRLNVIS